MERTRDSSTKVKFDQIFDTIDLKQRKTKIICTMGYVNIKVLHFWLDLNAGMLTWLLRCLTQVWMLQDLTSHMVTTK